ncbi:MAG: SBBP repeat-containing protein, partial [Candidatus Saccharicenans sp.]
MKDKKRKIIILVLVLAAIIGFSCLFAGYKAVKPPEIKALNQTRTLNISQLSNFQLAAMDWPLFFIPNRGQLDSRVVFYVQGRDKNIYFTDEGLTILLVKAEPDRAKETINNSKRPKLPDRLSLADRARSLVSEGRPLKPAQTQKWTVRLKFVDPCQRVIVEGDHQAETLVSYFKGGPDNWISGLPTYKKIRYRQLWPGVDLAFSGDQSKIKYEFLINPGAQPEAIKLTYEGASEIKVNDQGQLEVTTPAGSFVDEAPVAYQIKDGKRVQIPVNFQILKKEISGENLVSCQHTFKIGDYDRSQPLFIDPALIVYSGYIGGSSNDRALALALDNSGNVYLTGWTGSIDFPAQVGPDLTFNGPSLGTDAFVAKVNP